MVERRLAAILAADVVGYSKLIGADQTATLAALRRLRSELLAPSVSRHHGEIVKSMGDGWIIAFDSVADAVQCAIDVQTGISAIEMLRLRVGVHLGDIEHEDEDVFGDGVNVAARLEAAATPGGILISDVVHHSLDGRLAGAFPSKSLLKLKNIEREVEAFSWGDAPPDTSGEDEGDAPAAAQRQSINIGFDGLDMRAGDDEARLLCDGVNDAVRAALANRKGLSLLTDSGKADMQVQGSMQVVGDRYRAAIRLLDRRNQELIKAEKFDGRIADLFEAEDDLALRICTAIRFAVFKYEATVISDASQSPVEQDNDRLRVRAGSLLSDVNYDDWVEARRLMDIVLDRNPDDASALALAGMSRMVEPNCGWRPPASEDREQAIRQLRKAVKLNPSSDFAQAMLTLAFLELEEDFTGALFASEQLMKIAPHFAQGQMARAAALICSGETEEGTELALKAIEPLKGLRLFSQNAAYLMLGLLLSNRHDEVLVWGQMVNQRTENVPRNLILMISAAAHIKDHDLARKHVDHLVGLHADFRLGDMRVWPLRNTADWSHIVEGLQKADLPE